MFALIAPCWTEHYKTELHQSFSIGCKLLEDVGSLWLCIWRPWLCIWPFSGACELGLCLTLLSPLKIMCHWERTILRHTYGNLWHHVAPVTPHVCQTTFTRKVQAFHVFCTCDLGPSNLLGPALAARNETNRLLHYVSKNTLRCELVSAPVAALRAACSSSSVAAPVILRKNKSHTTKKDNEIPGCCWTQLSPTCHRPPHAFPLLYFRSVAWLMNWHRLRQQPHKNISAHQRSHAHAHVLAGLGTQPAVPVPMPGLFWKPVTRNTMVLHTLSFRIASRRRFWRRAKTEASAWMPHASLVWCLL